MRQYLPWNDAQLFVCRLVRVQVSLSLVHASDVIIIVLALIVPEGKRDHLVLGVGDSQLARPVHLVHLLLQGIVILLKCSVQLESKLMCMVEQVGLIRW